MRTTVLGIAMIMSIAQITGAMDIGNAVTVNDAKNMGVEVFYERYKRDVTQDIPGTDDQFSNEQDENRMFARLKFTGIQTVLLAVDVGMTESEGSEGYVPIYGCGLFKDVYSKNDVTLSLFLKATYVPEIEYKSIETYYSTDYLAEYMETYDRTRTESYWEYGAGFQLGKMWNLKGGSKLNTYGGILASFINSEGDETVDYSGTARDYRGNVYTAANADEESGVDFEEDQPVGLFLGIAFGLADSPFSIRAETRLLDQTSFSVGAGMSF